MLLKKIIIFDDLRFNEILLFCAFFIIIIIIIIFIIIIIINYKWVCTRWQW